MLWKQLNMCTQSVHCAAKHWTKQSVCTSLGENAVTHSVLFVSKNVTEGAFILKF
jgi:hypothetical protein